MKSCISLNEVWRPHKSGAGCLVGERGAEAWLVGRLVYQQFETSGLAAPNPRGCSLRACQPGWLLVAGQPGEGSHTCRRGCRVLLLSLGVLRFALVKGPIPVLLVAFLQAAESPSGPPAELRGSSARACPLLSPGRTGQGSSLQT